MKKKIDIVALGESLIDFVQTKESGENQLIMQGNAGGAPANVLAAATKLGDDTAFIGKVGNDAFGSFLKNAIAKSGVGISGMVTGSEETTLAMVTLDETGNRSFSFYRNETADVMIKESEVDKTLLDKATIFHFGTVSMSAQPCGATTIEAARYAKRMGAKISFDPNYRAFLWKNEKLAVQAMKEGLWLANYAKLSDEEAFLVTNEKNPEKAAKEIAKEYGLDFAAVTLGPNGCVGVLGDICVTMPTYDVKSVDTTGAGDAFWGAVLHKILFYAKNKPADEKEMLCEMLRYANAAGSLATTKFGAIPSLATNKEIEQCVKESKMLE